MDEKPIEAEPAEDAGTDDKVGKDAFHKYIQKYVDPKRRKKLLKGLRMFLTLNDKHKSGDDEVFVIDLYTHLVIVEGDNSLLGQFNRSTLKTNKWHFKDGTWRFWTGASKIFPSGSEKPIISA